MLRRPAALAIFAATLAAAPLPAAAKEIIVHMKMSGAEGMMVFEPSYVKAAPGDTIRFAPADGSHNAETLPAIWPEGAPTFKGAMGKEVVLTVGKPGLYGIKCLPHYSMGMIALIQVGKADPASVAAAQAVSMPPLARKRMAAALAKVK